MRFVRFLRAGEAGLVHAVVDEIVDPAIELVDAGAEGGRVQPRVALVGLALRGGQELVEAGGEHADNLAALVGDDGGRGAVPDEGDGVASVVGGVGAQVEVFGFGVAEDGVPLVGAVAAGEEPAFRAELPV